MSINFHVLYLFSFSRLIAVVSVRALFCATVVPAGAYMCYLEPYLHVEARRNLHLKWSVEKFQFSRKITPVSSKTHSQFLDLGRSQWSGNLLHKSMKNHVELVETEIKSKNIFLLFFATIILVPPVCQD